MKQITLLLLLISLSGYSQKEQLIDPITNKKCRIMEEYDKFNKKKTYRTSFDVSAGMGLMDFTLFKVVNENDESIRYMIMFQGLNGCISSSSSYVSIILNNKETIKLNYEGPIDCGSSYSMYFVNEDFLRQLSENKITDIRVFNDRPFDVTINEKQDKRFKSHIYCLLNTN